MLKQLHKSEHDGMRRCFQFHANKRLKSLNIKINQLETFDIIFAVKNDGSILHFLDRTVQINSSDTPQACACKYLA